MHVATKDSSQDGKTHLLTTVIEADGPFAICTEDAVLSGEVISVKRTVSGGIEAVCAIRINAEVPAPIEELKTEELAPSLPAEGVHLDGLALPVPDDSDPAAESANSDAPSE